MLGQFLVSILTRKPPVDFLFIVIPFPGPCSHFEIEINVMDIECTDRRIGDMEILTHEVTAWTRRRNDDEKKINWGFTRGKADKKLSKYYV
ncbi:MAG: hypothetical protein AEth_01187 [Candidatus Argoarchaeum ethanivorans]|uniref:Uncharacterized protein n=1 Tax=Candidatus Argoarchaeum ethanivorans TaxID=2608793 RepID=A0A8B3S239_9EURY|nr:MAG: hypothetical protein AEth_01187 [Candidatus Argoarchaeum ethanivorans]